MCVFCSIGKGEIPSFSIYEDDQVKAFLDISQVTKGHVLIIPRKHYESFLECDDETLAHLSKVAKMLSKRVIERTNAKGMNILSNIGEVAGQSVQHFHLHLIPRYDKQDACVIHFEESKKQDLDALMNLLK